MSFYHIDTDMGVDDGLSLLVADRFLHGVVALSTVFGNVPVEVATRNAVIIRELLKPTDGWDIVTGAECAVDGFRWDARHMHGTDGLGGAVAGLDPALLRRVSSQVSSPLTACEPPSAGPVTLIGLGPATNIPNLVSWYGQSVIERIILMTGVFFDVGNITGFAEFNAYCDPFALQATLDLGIPVTIVPLDVCRKVQLSRERVANFQRVDGSPLGRLIATSHMHEMDMYCEQEGIDGCFPHDALTVLAAVAREYFYCVRGRVAVDGSADLRGRTTIILDDTSHVEVITGGNLKWCRERLDDLLLGRAATQSGQPPRPTARVAG